MIREETDIIVVGGGGSGLTAAIFARQAGAKVILLEKHEELRGSTGLSIGSITASGTWHQKRAGVTDSADAHFEDMGAMARKFLGDLEAGDNLELRRILVDNVTESVDWLMSLGVTFYGPMPEPPHRQPRMHNILPNSRAYIWFLAREAKRVGVDARVRATVTRLILDGGKVVGVEAAVGGRAVELRARKAVILATGDYSSSGEWKGRFNPAVADVDGVNTTNVGDGHRFGEELGAAVKFGQVVYGPNLRFMPPAKPSLLLSLPPWPWFTKAMRMALELLPSWLLRPFILSFVTTYLSPEPSMFKEGSILVNKRGERFTDELDKPTYAFGPQPDKQGFIVFDDEVAQKFRKWPYFISTAPGVAYAYLDDYRRTRPDLYHKAATIGELARSMGVPAEALERTVRDYNAETPGTGRPALARGPFYGLGPVKSWIILTDGGLTVNRHHQVTKVDGTVVPGLYAVGSVGQGGLLLEGHGHHLAWAFTSGRLAARHAAANPR
ncbi:FAD-dependent oxidoreductase [Zavarzinia compransoris]|uniref:FAD-binding dehydrogenase n=1 Tax=Zavarzinia compransoris TaxID=1264899 RepID=A0A317E3N3_9PROT|nr:FAD-dependent oxidoreductase [Zavarzinia compransoris]PWR20994.1 FAD-binding dehydrogenase [Zavarzinia compransoris]TDP44026.1 fumarate reductase flavoprotein subunit [Zavarzinia compransoris]